MTLKQPDPALADPRFTTVYRASQGGYYPIQPKPVPGTPKEIRK